MGGTVREWVKSTSRGPPPSPPGGRLRLVLAAVNVLGLLRVHGAGATPGRVGRCGQEIVAGEDVSIPLRGRTGEGTRVPLGPDSCPCRSWYWTHPRRP